MPRRNPDAALGGGCPRQTCRGVLAAQGSLLADRVVLICLSCGGEYLPREPIPTDRTERRPA